MPTGTKMKILLFLILLLPSCAGIKIKDTCDTYCYRTGGQCHHIEQGERRFNTTTGSFEERPTYFVCTYNQ